MRCSGTAAGSDWTWVWENCETVMRALEGSINCDDQRGEIPTSIEIQD